MNEASRTPAERARHRPPREHDERGLTTVELIIASALLMMAMVSFLATLGSMQKTANYQATRNQALDDLRTTAGVFAKDARHAQLITLARPDEVVMDTYVSGQIKSVRYQVVMNGAERDLVRIVDGGAERVFVIRLTSASIFSYDIPQADLDSDPQKASRVRRAQLIMESRPSKSHPPVVLSTEVSLRNVT